MKEIFAIIRPGKDRETKEALAKIGCFTFTSLRVKGRGRQRGLRYTASTAQGSASLQPATMQFLPKKMLYMVVSDRQIKPAIQAIIRINQTNHYGDGKIFVLGANEARRIRTGEKGEAALL